MPCYFDEHFDYLIQTDPDFEQTIFTNENLIQDMMEQNPQAIMNSEVYSIPVVFHVIYKDTETNISNSLIYQALQDLNDNFRNVQNLGNDVEIEFCLAVRNPQGGSTSGINRVSGLGVNYYQTSGLTIGLNEGEIKNLSRWPNDQYLNIWIVSEITDDPIYSILGFATFPGTNPTLDGIVLDYHAAGSAQYATVIAHEAGHYFKLYHTFEGGSPTTCASNIDCHYEGDKCCETKPHKLLTVGCDENATNDCTSQPFGDLVPNYMNYFPPDCHFLFKNEQIMLMRGALMMSRASLLESLGCTPSCNDVNPDFTISDITVNMGDSPDFTNITTPSQATYIWTVEDQEFTTFDLNYTFNNLGPVVICLKATYNGCTNEHCELIEVIGRDDCSHPEIPECELLYNGMFDRNNVQIGAVDHFLNNPQANLNKVCNWINKLSTPFFCSNLGQDVFGLLAFSPNQEESIVTMMEVPFVDGEFYKVTFEYFIGNAGPEGLELIEPTLIVGLAHSSDLGSMNDDAIIKMFPGLPFDDYEVSNLECLNPNTNFNYREFTFPYTADMGKYLYFRNLYTGAINESIIYIRDIHIPTCEICTPVPDFEYQIADCWVSFEGESLGDEALYYHWDFGDGMTSSDQNVIHEYLFPGTFNVCLNIACSPELSATECKQIEIIGPCTSCTELDDVTAIACNTNESTLNTYIANFSTDIPDDYNVCDGSDLFIYSDDVMIEVSSYEIEDNSPDDLLHVGLVITSPLGYDFTQQGAIGNFILCDKDDEPICFTIRFSSEVCDECIEAETPSIATCNELLSDLTTYVYDGSLTIDVGLSNYNYNDFESSELGFSVLSATQSGSVWTIQYRITVSNLYFSSTNIILYFEFGSTILCVSSEIIVTEPCSDLPNDCIEEWDPKLVSVLCTERGDYLGFPFYMQAPSNGYTICEGGLFGTIDGGGIVETVHAQIQGSKLTFSLNILMPSNYNTHQTYYLRIYLCDNNGDLVCYLFPLQFECLESFQEPIETRNTTQGYESVVFSLFPNPTFLSIAIEYPEFDPSQSFYLGVTDLMGQKMINQQITGNISIVNVSKLAGGLYFVSLIRNGSILSTQKVVVLQ